MWLIKLICVVTFFEYYSKNVIAQTNELRIVGGFNASRADTMHQVSIRLINADSSFGNGHICGGSLISNNTVLTAAHCLYDSSEKLRPPSAFRIVGGNLVRTNQDSNTFVTKAIKLTPHKNYDYRTLSNDIALITLEAPVSSNHSTFRPINLSTMSRPVGTACQISGWGTTAYQGSSSYTLLAANVTILNKTICNANYGNSLASGTICAGSWAGGVDACQGDSGGPLVCSNILTGVVSSGYRCAVANYPGIYTDVYAFHSWIIENKSSCLKMNFILLGAMLFILKNNLTVLFLVF